MYLWHASLPAAYMALGTALTCVAYSSIQPAIAFLVALLIAVGFSFLFCRRSPLERGLVIDVVCVAWVGIGISSIYSQVLNDGLMHSDGMRFFWFSTGEAFAGMSLDSLSELTEGAAAVFIWQRVYSMASTIGLSSNPYIGQLTNATMVAIAAVFCLKTARLLYGEDPSSFRTLRILVLSCGMFLLYSSTHLRDSLALLVVCFAIFCCCNFLSRPTPTALLLAVSLLVVFALVAKPIRQELFYVPFVLACLTTLSLAVHGAGSLLSRVAVSVISLAVFVFLLWYFSNLQEEITNVLFEQGQRYGEHSKASASHDSLGIALTQSLPYPARVALNAVLLLILPLPVWSGLELVNEYHFFKSIHAIFMYATLPLVLLGCSKIHSNTSTNPSIWLFLSLVFLGFLFATAVSSVENRHMGSFLLPYIVIASSVKIARTETMLAYKKYLSISFLLGLSLHFIWFSLKFS